MNGSVSLRNKVVFVVVGLYLLFNYSFMQVRLPPTGGSGIPVGELVLLWVLFTSNVALILGRLASQVVIAPFIIWWAFGLSRALLGGMEYGIWGLRDATHVIESLFLLVGYSLCERPDFFDKFYGWFPKIFFSACVLALTYPFREHLQSISPMITSGAGHRVSLLFSYANTPYLLLMTACYLLIFRDDSRGVRRNFFLVILLLGFTVFLFQARTIYLQIIALFILFSCYRPQIAGRGAIALMVCAAFLVVMPLVDIQVEGRLGQKVSAEFIAKHFLAIGGVESSGVEGAAGGVPQRIGWWTDIYHRLTEDASHMTLGLGYGFPLIDFGLADDVKVREPHNSYISIMARLGLVGFISWIWLHALLLKTWHRAYKSCLRVGWKAGQDRLLIVMVFFVLTWVLSLGEDGFEKPFNAIPYYFLWGIVLRFSSYLNNGIIGPHRTDNANPSSS